MKLYRTATVLWSFVASALSLPLMLPGSVRVNHDSKDILTASGSSSSDEVSLRFETPCQGCLPSTDAALVFHVLIRRVAQTYEKGHIAINGQEISWSDNGSVEGAGAVQAHLAGGLGQHQLIATWNGSCVTDEAYILSFRILQVDDNVVENSPGFTISFKQYGRLEVLRLVGEAIDITHAKDLAGQWTHADQTQHLPLCPIIHNSGRSCLNGELLQLDALKAQTYSLQKLIGDKKHRMHQLLQDGFRAFCSTFKKCDSLQRIFRTIAHEVHHYAHIGSLHFSHGSLSPQQSVSSKSQRPVEGLRKQGDDAVRCDDSYSRTELPPSSAQLDDYSPVDHEVILPTLPSHHGHSSSSPIASYSRQLSPTPTPHNSGSNLSPTPSPNHAMRLHLHSGPYSSPRYQHYQLALPILIFVGLSTMAFIILRHCLLLCASADRQASRLWCREQRRNRCAFRRAARRQAWSNWWNRYRRPASTTDYEEKRTLILDQEGVLEDQMQGEIHALTLAHEIAREAVRAEEGRSRLYQQANMRHHWTPRPRELHGIPSSSSPDGPGYRRSSLASFQSAGSQPPPAYEEELEAGIDVANGFMYMPTFCADNHPTSEDGDGLVDDATPDSSVVDCSPRMSFDTGRTTLNTAKDRE